MENEKDLQNIRTRYFTFVLYPDNPYHMEYLQFLEATADGFYIYHQKGDELANIPLVGVQQDQKISKGKAHIHVFQIFKNPRTVKGLLKSLPTMKYYKVLDRETEKPFFLTLYDLPYINLPVEEVSKLVVEHIEPVTDRFALATYFLHQDYKSVALGKKRYETSDIHMLSSDRSILSEYFLEYQLTDSQIVDIVQQIYACSDGDKNLFVQLCCMHSLQVIKYVQSHAYFIKTFIFTKENNVNDRISTYCNS